MDFCLYPISDQKDSKTIPFGFGATHTYIAYVREQPPGAEVRVAESSDLP